MNFVRFNEIQKNEKKRMKNEFNKQKQKECDWKEITFK